LLGGDPRRIPELGGPDFGTWAGRTLSEVATEDPGALESWLSDPQARPHGGESLVMLVARVSAVLDSERWPVGLTAAVVTPLVARALAVSAVGAPVSVMFRIEVAPLGRILLTSAGQFWRLRLGDS
jgi:broad specificity phosphatase PhoE